MKQRITISNNKVLPVLAQFYEFFAEAKDKDRLEKILAYYRKAMAGDLSVVFCGHFSAGKSSLLNALSEDGTLPVSPVPTSANIVVLRKGPSKARVYLHNGEYGEFLPPFDINEIKRLCKNGDLVKEIEIFTPHFGLEGIALYDTPGIDSTDDAHYKAADEVSDAADIIFYVMDYNHVLSETNFHFIEKLSRRGQHVKLIINQMDKHLESELPITSFKEKVEESFGPYGITKEDIFYTSVLNRSLEGNDLNALRALIEKASIEKENILEKEWRRRLQWLAADYAEKHKPETEEHIEDIIQHAEERKNELTERLQLAEELESDEKKKWRNDVQNILRDAILMPFETRELGGKLLESLQPKFKVGFFMSQNKTANEKKQRLQSFADSLNKNIETQVMWHLRRLFDEFSKKYGADAGTFSFTVHESLLTQSAKSGMDADGKALLHYCEHIAGEVRKMISQKLQPFFDLVNAEAEKLSKKEHKSIKLQLAEAEQEIQKHQQEINRMRMWKKEKDRLERIAGGSSEYDGNIEGLFQASSGSKIDITKILQKEPIKAKKVQSKGANSSHSTNSLSAEKSRLAHNVSLLESLPGFAEDAEDANHFLSRVEKRTYTMVLFGAFSSGKSSFANALIGEKVLPTSPNPMTAAIFEIIKPDVSHPHGTVQIECKSEEEMLAEINDHLSKTGNNASSLKQAGELAKKSSVSGSSRFISAFMEGFEEMSSKAGSVFTSGLQDIERYGAYEPFACYVKKITVYYSCKMTESGIVLVDTPGADSINSRHTDVAFQYIKNSDMILYVTYYNHAFSSADREFLIQLGRVKDVFLADKMFFVLNACDLAQDQEEVLQVASHIKDNLSAFGIRNPRLYPVSSHTELKEGNSNNKNNESGFSSLRSEISAFLEVDLANVIASQCSFKNSFLKEKLTSIVDDLGRSKEEREERKNQMLAEAERWRLTAQSHFAVPQEKLDLEITELIHYVKQRVNLRSHDFFKECFHSGIMLDAKNSGAALVSASHELWRKAEYDLNQEVKATSLRIEKWINSFIKEKDQFFRENISSAIKVDAFDMSLLEYRTPALSHVLVSPDEVDTKKWNKTYKNARQFFEGSGRDEMKEMLIEVLEKRISAWADEALIVIKEHYELETKEKSLAASKHFDKQIGRSVDMWMKAYSNPDQEKDYKEALSKMK
ncbi:dynamin family protein [Fictibacillus aquaticus]|uniref:dynamin family protein n=1 Tax=Fictibacillus aquaticus TaxID=2021314 RepID=UPI0013FD4F81|nr:dynamin family protein [Fictibacillus aquaticus]